MINVSMDRTNYEKLVLAFYYYFDKFFYSIKFVLYHLFAKNLNSKKSSLKNLNDLQFDCLLFKN